MTKTKTKAGRPPLSALAKAKSQAGRAYRGYLETLEPEFIRELDTKRIQFAESRHRMGRPPKPVAQHQREAKEKWLEAWAKYEEECEKAGEAPESPENLKEYRKEDKAGRPRADQVIALKKYIRRQQTLLKDVENTSAEVFDKQITENRHGRIPMSKLEKIQVYKDRIDRAKKEVEELIAAESEANQIHYQIYELQVERRQLRQLVRNPDSPQVINMEIDAKQAKQKISRINKKIEALEDAYKEALEKEIEQARDVKEMPRTSEELDQRYAEIMDGMEPEQKTQVDEETRRLKERNEKIRQLLEKEREKRRAEQLRKEAEEMGIDIDRLVI